MSIISEISFILSIFFGYVVFGTISGTQHKGEFNVYNNNTRVSSYLQITSLALGTIFFFFSIKSPTKVSTRHSKVTLTFSQSPYKTDTIIRLNNIFFDFSHWTLRPESYYELSKLVDTLRKYNRLCIVIQAHTDNIGSDVYNLSLSEKRAASVVRYLYSHGIPTNQVSAKGFGETMPIATNDNYQGRQINRRVEFKVLKSN
jgi:outer membrane protein OmpA-like peptidoglycan-associated protein